MNFRSLLEQDARLKGFQDGLMRALRVCVIARFGMTTPKLDALLATIDQPEQIDHVMRMAATLPSVEALVYRLSNDPELAPAPASFAFAG